MEVGWVGVDCVGGCGWGCGFLYGRWNWGWIVSVCLVEGRVEHKGLLLVERCLCIGEMADLRKKPRRRQYLKKQELLD